MPRASEMITALRRCQRDLTTLVTGLDGPALRRQSYSTEWSIAQVLSHVGSGAEISGLMLTSALDGTELDQEAFAPIWET